jgi:hypothetical protein
MCFLRGFAYCGQKFQQFFMVIPEFNKSIFQRQVLRPSIG